MKSILGYLIIALIVATVIGFSINTFTKHNPENSISSPATSNTSGQANTSSPTPPGINPTESGCPQEGHIKSPSSYNSAVITFDNQTASDLSVYWIDFNGKRKFYSNLKAHSKYNQDTWIGHVWVVTDMNGKCLKLESANAKDQVLEIN